MKDKTLALIYTNWRGVTGVRTITPQSIWFGSTSYHEDEQWLMKAFDEKGVEKDFAVKDMEFV